MDVCATGLSLSQSSKETSNVNDLSLAFAMHHSLPWAVLYSNRPFLMRPMPSFLCVRSSSTALLSELARSFVPGHPMSGMHYVCTPNLTLYSQAGFSKDAYLAQVAANVQLKAAGEPHPNIWLPDSNNQDYYLIDMPGTLARLQRTHTHTHTHACP
jgi:hypothetical protein